MKRSLTGRLPWWSIVLLILFVLLAVEASYYGWKTLNLERPLRSELAVAVTGEGSVNPGEGRHRYDAGELVIFEAKPAKGWLFSHWEGPVSDELSPRTYLTLDDDCAIKAVFVEDKPDYYNLELAQEGKGTIFPEVGTHRLDAIEEGIPVTLSAVPDEGFQFKGWSENGIIVSEDETYEVVVSEDLALVAKFIPLYSITVQATEGGSAAAPVGKLEKGVTVTVTGRAHSGYGFAMWTDNGEKVSEDPSYSFTVEGDHALKAHFLPLHTVSVVAGAGGTAGPLTTRALEGTQIRLEAKPKPGYAFLNWTEDGRVIGERLTFGPLSLDLRQQSNPVYEFTLNRSRRLQANFVPVYTVDTAASPCKGGTVKAPSKQILGGTQAALFAIPNEGYGFEKWTEGGIRVSSDPVYHFTGKANRTLTAHFVRTSEIKTDVAPANVYDDEGALVKGGLVSGAGEYNKGAKVTLRARLAGKTLFSHWEEILPDGSRIPLTDVEGPEYSFIADGSRHLVAVFKHPFVVDTAADPIEGGTVKGGGIYPVRDSEGNESKVTVKARPNFGYRFKHWLKDGTVMEDAGSEYTFKAENCTLEAVFEKVETYAITVKAGKGGRVSGGGKFAADSKVTLFAFPESGYRFAGWQEDGTIIDGASQSYSFAANCDRSLKAVFVPVYLVDVSVEGEEEDDRDEPLPGRVTGKGFYAEGDEVTVKAIAAYGFKFDRWTEDGVTVEGAGEAYTFTVNKERRLVAHFVEACWITADVKGLTEFVDYETESIVPGEVIGAGIYTLGSTVTLKAQPFSGYIFMRWTEGGRDLKDESNELVGSPYSFTAEKHRHLVAHFYPGHHVNLDVAPEGTGTATGGGGFVKGRYATITAEPSEGYLFRHWREGDQLYPQNPYTFRVERDHNFTAVFGQSCNITCEVVPEGGGTVRDAGAYPMGETITVQARAADGYRFIRWTDADGNFLGDSRELTFEVTGDRHLIAHFEESPYFEISVRSAQPAMGSVSGGGEYEVGEPVTVVATPVDANHRFVKWTEDGVTVSTSATYGFEAERNRDLVAHFELITYTVTVNVNDEDLGDVRITAPSQWERTWGKRHVLEDVPRSTVLQLEARVLGDNDWDKWSDGEKNQKRSYTVTSAATVTARFKEKSGGLTCPFVYSYNEDGYHFENEALPQSVSKALEYTYHGTLRELKAVDGAYHVQIAEEELEKSFIDWFEFYAIDYPADSGVAEVVTDVHGRPHTIEERVKPISFHDYLGNSWLREVTTKDQTLQSDSSGFYEGVPVVTYEAEFPLNGANPKEARLMLDLQASKTATDCWAWFMDVVDGKNNQWWIDEILNRDSVKEQFIVFTDIVALRVELWNGTSWELVDLVRPGGAAMQEYVLPIDLDSVDSDEDVLKVRFRGGAGFFIFDTVAMDFSENKIAAITELRPETALLNGEKDVLEGLSRESEQRVRILHGEAVDLVYSAPELSESNERGFMIALRGYYHTHPEAVENPIANYWNELSAGEIFGRVLKTIPGAVKVMPKLVKMYRLMTSVTELPFEEKLSRIMLDHVLPWIEQNETE